MGMLVNFVSNIALLVRSSKAISGGQSNFMLSYLLATGHLRFVLQSLHRYLEEMESLPKNANEVNTA